MARAEGPGGRAGLRPHSARRLISRSWPWPCPPAPTLPPPMRTSTRAQQPGLPDVQRGRRRLAPQRHHGLRVEQSALVETREGTVEALPPLGIAHLRVNVEEPLSRRRGSGWG